MPVPVGNIKAVIPAEQQKAELKPGDVAFRGFERKDNVFYVTFVWCDMIGGLHEHTFNRGDVFADFQKVLRIFTDGGLPIDPAKGAEFHQRLCQLSTVMIQEEAEHAEPEAAPKAAKDKKEEKKA